MVYIFTVISLITVFLLFISSKRLLRFFNLTNIKFSTYDSKEKKPVQLEQKLLVQLARFEKKLYKLRFTRRIIVEFKSDLKNRKKPYYKFYYYQLIDGIHAYIEAIPASGKNYTFNYCFETAYESGNVCLSTNKESFILNSKPNNMHLFIHKNLSIRELYNAHLKDRQIPKERIYKKRMSPQEFIASEINKERDYIENLVKNGYAKYINGSFKFIPSFKLFKKTNKICKLLNLNRYGIKPVFYLSLIYIFTAFSIFGGYIIIDKLESTKNRIKIANPKKELKEFNFKVASFSGITGSYKKTIFSLKEPMAQIDAYLKKSKIKRVIGAPYEGPFDINQSCALPEGLLKMYKWHNGVEQLIPNRNFTPYEYAKSSFTNNLSKNTVFFVFAFQNAIEYKGLAVKCNDNGIYSYSLKMPSIGNKEFYNIGHFLSVIAKSYSSGAFYDDYDTLKINLKKFLKIYRKFYTPADKKRYLKFKKYLKSKALYYLKSSSLELKKAALNEIAKTYDPDFISTVLKYLKLKNSETAASAIDALGNIGDKRAVPVLLKYLKSDSQRLKDKALIAIAKIVDKNDTGILKYIYPLLNDKSLLVRLSAYEVLYSIGSKSSLEILKKHFANAKPAEKLSIIKIIGKIGTKNEIPLLNSYLKEIEKMDLNQEINSTVKGSDPHPKILQYEIYRAVARINDRN